MVYLLQPGVVTALEVSEFTARCSVSHTRTQVNPLRRAAAIVSDSGAHNSTIYEQTSRTEDRARACASRPLLAGPSTIERGQQRSIAAIHPSQDVPCNSPAPWNYPKRRSGRR